jgi:hypothetical protein
MTERADGPSGPNGLQPSDNLSDSNQQLKDAFDKAQAELLQTRLVSIEGQLRVDQAKEKPRV